MATQQPTTKTDKNGDYYCSFSGRGFANEADVYRVRPDELSLAWQIHNKAARLNGGWIHWLDAGDAVRAVGSPMPLSRHPWYPEMTQD